MQQCLISIVDILGTKGIWTEYTVDRYFEVIERVKQELEKGKQYFKTLPNSEFIEFDFATFSDTLVITLINKGQQYDYFFDETIEGFSRLNLGIFQSYLSDSFFLRGCISFGNIEKRGNHFIGPAVDDAAEYFDSQEMIGICLTPKVSLAMKYAINWNKKYNDKQIDKYVTEYLTPLKNKSQAALFQINWVNHFVELYKKDDEIDPLNVFIRFLSKRNIPAIALAKFSNTVEFFKFAEKNYS